MLLALDSRPVTQAEFFPERNSLTSDEELPAAVSFATTGPLEAAIRITDVRTETTDDN
jgi:hypothetical protein